VQIASYLKAGSHTTVNIILYVATLGTYLWLEGRVRRGVFRNWARRFRYAPIMYVEPSKEEEIARIVRNSAKVRVLGRATPSTKKISATSSSCPWIITVASCQRIWRTIR
jgi:hypothetical protein